MAQGLNQCNFIGNLGRDPEVRRTNSGAKVVNLRLAVSNSWRDKESGDRRERTEWVSVVIWAEGLAGVAEQYLKKGSAVFVSGEMQTRKWQDQSGADRYTTEIVLNQFGGRMVLLGGRAEGEGGGDEGAAPQTRQSKPAPAATLAEELDDEIPF